MTAFHATQSGFCNFLDQLPGTNGDDNLALDTSKESGDPSGATSIDGKGGNDHIEIGAYVGIWDPVTVDGGTGNDIVNIAGVLSGHEAITVDGGADDDTLFVNVSGVHPGALSFSFSSSFSFSGLSASNFEAIGLTTGDGNDDITGGALADTLQTAGGLDTLNGRGGNDALFGGADADQIFGGSGNDGLYGGGGNDTLDGGQGQNTLDGGDGHDTVEYNATALQLAEGVQVSLAAGRSHFDDVNRDTLVSIENVTGTFLADTIVGDAGANVLEGLASDDVLVGGNGDPNDTGDKLYGGNGKDAIYGQGGDDTIDGGKQDDTLYGGAGTDTIDGGEGDDTIDGGAGYDKLDGGPGSDVLDYSQNANFKIKVDLASGKVFQKDASGHYQLTAERVHNFEFVNGGDADEEFDASPTTLGIDGGGGNDVLRVARVDDAIGLFGGNGNDKLFGPRHGTSALHGGNGDDVIAADDAGIVGWGDKGADKFIGGAGDDVLIGGDDNDVIHGNGGDDKLYGGDFGGEDEAEKHHRDGADQISGGSGDDDIAGKYGPDTLYGGDGADVIFAGYLKYVDLDFGRYNRLENGLTKRFADDYASPNDNYGTESAHNVLYGGAGPDILLGSDGKDTIDGGPGNDGIGSGGGDDTVTGGPGDDLIVAGNGNDKIDPGSGRDTVYGEAGDDVVTLASVSAGSAFDGGSGFDTLDMSAVTRALTVNLPAKHLIGGGGTSSIVGFEKIIGGSRGNSLRGDQHDNILSGGGGNDTLDGGAGNDTLNGGDGEDTASYAFNGTGVTVNLALTHAQNTGGAGKDTLKNIENLAGSDHNDTLMGDSGANRIAGNDGNDVIVGAGGGDRLIGGRGADDIDGGGGNDVFVYGTATDSTSTHYDTVRHADFAGDKWDITGNVTGIDATITHGKLTTAHFDANLAAAADAAHLGAHHAVIFTPNSGTLAGKTFLIVDLNGTAGYQGGDDLVVMLVAPAHLSGLGANDFI